MKLGVIALDGYREWTEKLGNDREWIIQKFQHFFSSKITEYFSEIGSFIITYRYDSYITFLDGVNIDEVLHIVRKIEKYSPVNIQICFGYGKTYLEAEKNCYLSEKDIRKYEDEKVVVAHFDLNGFSLKRSLLTAYLKVSELYYEIFKKSVEIGALSYYFGGDNIGVFLNKENLVKVYEILNIADDLKVGIGIGRNAREALKNASKALDVIRTYRDRRMEIIENDS